MRTIPDVVVTYPYYSQAKRFVLRMSEQIVVIWPEISTATEFNKTSSVQQRYQVVEQWLIKNFENYFYSRHFPDDENRDGSPQVRSLSVQTSEASATPIRLYWILG
jgi:hypothetical protein